MLKKITYFVSFVLIIVLLAIFYLSYCGIQTDRFNNNISKQLKKNYPKLEIKFKEIKLLLNPISLLISVETKNPTILAIINHPLKGAYLIIICHLINNK